MFRNILEWNGFLEVERFLERSFGEVKGWVDEDGRWVDSTKDPVGVTKDPVGALEDPVGAPEDPVGAIEDRVVAIEDLVGATEDSVGEEHWLWKDIDSERILTPPSLSSNTYVISVPVHVFMHDFDVTRPFSDMGYMKWTTSYCSVLRPTYHEAGLRRSKSFKVLVEVHVQRFISALALSGWD